MPLSSENYANTQRLMLCSYSEGRWKTPALSEVFHELSTAAFGTERKRVLRITTQCRARPA